MGFAEQFDFRWVNALLVVEREPGHPVFRSVGSSPEAFTSQKDPQLAMADPVVTRLRKEGLPFVYDQAFYVEHGASVLWEHAAPFGYRTGISVALRMNRRRQLLLGMDREDRLPTAESQVARMLADLQMLAVHCADATEQILGPMVDQSPTGVLLTPREQDVLKWTSEGLKAFAVGEKLNISGTPAVFVNGRYMNSLLFGGTITGWIEDALRR